MFGFPRRSTRNARVVQELAVPARRCSLLLAPILLAAATGAARAGEPPKKVTATTAPTDLKTALLFPSPSELATRLKMAGIRVVPLSKANEKVPAPAWAKLSTLDQQLQLGSVLGYLAFSAASADMKTLSASLEQVLLGAESLGVDRKSLVYQSLAQLRERINGGQISDAQVMAALDDLRRDALREITSRTKVKDPTFIMAAAWLRGSSLLAHQVKSDADASHLAEFVMRPELMAFIERIPNPASGGVAPARRTAAGRILALAKKPAFKRADFDDLANLADTILR